MLDSNQITNIMLWILQFGVVLLVFFIFTGTLSGVIFFLLKYKKTQNKKNLYFSIICIFVLVFIILGIRIFLSLTGCYRC